MESLHTWNVALPIWIRTWIGEDDSVEERINSHILTGFNDLGKLRRHDWMFLAGCWSGGGTGGGLEPPSYGYKSTAIGL